MVKIDIVMPTYCYDCPCHNGENGRCNITGDSVFDKRPFDCPLREDKSTTDVEEVKHGEWEDDADDLFWGNYIVKKHCSECGYTPEFDRETELFNLTKRCPNCGAKMDGGAGRD